MLQDEGQGCGSCVPCFSGVMDILGNIISDLHVHLNDLIIKHRYTQKNL